MGGTLFEVGVTFFFVGRGYSQSWSHRGVLGKGASHRGAPGGFPRGDPNVPVADCVRRSPLGTFTFKDKAK